MKYLKNWRLFEELYSSESYTEITSDDFENIAYDNKQLPFSTNDINILNKIHPYEWINISNDESTDNLEQALDVLKKKCEIGKSYLCKSNLKDQNDNDIHLTIFKIEDEYFIVTLRITGFLYIDADDDDDFTFGNNVETSYYKCDQLHGLKQLLEDKELI